MDCKQALKIFLVPRNDGRASSRCLVNRFERLVLFLAMTIAIVRHVVLDISFAHQIPIYTKTQPQRGERIIEQVLKNLNPEGVKELASSFRIQKMQTQCYTKHAIGYTLSNTFLISESITLLGFLENLFFVRWAIMALTLKTS